MATYTYIDKSAFSNARKTRPKNLSFLNHRPRAMSAMTVSELHESTCPSALSSDDAIYEYR